MNKKRTALIVVMVVSAFALAAFAMPASAGYGDPGAGCPSLTKHHGTIHGGVYFEYDSSYPTHGKTMTFDNVPDGIKLAKVYFGIWQGSPGKGGNFTLDIVNDTGGTYNSPVYRSCDPCPTAPCGIYPNAYQNDDTRCDHLFWEGNPPGTPPHNKPPNVPSDNIRGYITGCGVQFISFNATPYITPGSNTITVTPEVCSYPSCPCYNSNWDCRVYTIALLVVYEDPSMSEVTYWINEGAVYMEHNSDCDGSDHHHDVSFWVNGTAMIANPVSATYEVLGLSHVLNACNAPAYTKINSNDIGCPDYVGYAGGGDVYVRYDDILDSTTLQNNNFVEYYDDDPYYERGNVAWIVVKPELMADLSPVAIEHDTIYNGTLNIINATVENLGYGDASEFNVTLGVDSSVVDTVTVSELAAGANTTVLLAWTPDSTSSYTLNVTADADNTVDESNEQNNWLETIVTPVEIPETDLVVTDVCDGNVFVEEENMILAVIENNGEDASGFNVSLEVDGEVVNKTFVPMLYFRSRQLVWLDWTPASPGDNVQMNITVDCDGEITELDENNNTRSQVVNLVYPTIIKVPDEYSAIQSAIDNAPNDTMILVEPGVYNETLTIPADKSSIRLIANGSDVVIQPDGGGRQYMPFLISLTTNFNVIQGFTLIDGNPPIVSGIEISPGARWNIILNNYIGNMDCGIYLRGSWNVILENRVGNSSAGLPCNRLMDVTGTVNAICENTFDGDTGGGWRMSFDHDGAWWPWFNVVYCNNFTVTGVGGGPGPTVFEGASNLIFNNKINDVGGAIVTRTTNRYHIRLMPGGNIVHGPFLGGNYWTGNTGFVDANRDLIDDVPYWVDTLPLIKAKCGDVNCDGSVVAGDGLATYNHAIHGFSLCNLWAADANCDGGVVAGDGLAIYNHAIHGFPLGGCCKDCGLN